jgi:hypothetical protein
VQGLLKSVIAEFIRYIRYLLSINAPFLRLALPNAAPKPPRSASVLPQNFLSGLLQVLEHDAAKVGEPCHRLILSCMHVLAQPHASPKYEQNSRCLASIMVIGAIATLIFQSAL